MNDVWVVCWKELREMINGSGDHVFWAVRIWQTYLGRLVLVVGLTMIVLGVEGSRLLTNFGFLFFPIVAPFLLITTWVVDSFVGERERQTLATLLASRLPEGAIFWGKVIVPIMLITMALMIAALGGWVIAAIRSSSPVAVFYLWTVPVLGFVASSLGASVSVLLSERSQNIRGAQQNITYAALGAFLAISVLVNRLPIALRRHILVDILTHRITILFAYGIPAVAILEAFIWYLAFRRFVRSKLVS